MITENYVSFETAKLLKEKGFDEATNRYYNAQYDQIRTVSDTFLLHWNDEEFTKRAMLEGALAIPTLQMTMKWLRETHNVHVVPKYDFFAGYYVGRIYDGRKESASERDDYIVTIGYDTYEEASESAIKYCLENLI